MDEPEWIRVFETTKMYEAMMVQSLLNDHHIECTILNQKDSLIVTIGEIGVYVKLEDSIDAVNIIDNEIF